MPRYRIIVSGGLGEAGREAFRDFHIETHGGDTVPTGDLDQAGLLGALARIEGWDWRWSGSLVWLPPDAGATGLSNYSSLERGPAWHFRNLLPTERSRDRCPGGQGISRANSAERGIKDENR